MVDNALFELVGGRFRWFKSNCNRRGVLMNIEGIFLTYNDASQICACDLLKRSETFLFWQIL